MAKNKKPKKDKVRDFIDMIKYNFDLAYGEGSKKAEMFVKKEALRLALNSEIDDVLQLISMGYSVGFTLSKKAATYEVDVLCDLIINRAKQGHTLDMILYDLDIPNSKWMPYLKKHRKLQTCCADASVYHKAYGQRQLLSMALDKKRHSPSIVKILMANFYDIKEEFEPPKAKVSGSANYKVTTRTVKERVKGETNGES